MNTQTSQTYDTSEARTVEHDRLGVSLPRDLLARIRADAAREHRPVSWQVELIARQHYEREDGAVL